MLRMANAAVILSFRSERKEIRRLKNQNIIIIVSKLCNILGENASVIITNYTGVLSLVPTPDHNIKHFQVVLLYQFVFQSDH